MASASSLPQIRFPSPRTLGSTQERKATPQRYALEIEGIAYHPASGLLFLGLKYPLSLGSAILLAFDPQSRKFERFYRLDLSGKSISDLTFSDNLLLLATNPSLDEAYASSGLWSLKPDRQGLPQSQPGSLKVTSDPTAKLEGLAVLNGRLWLAYEGKAPHWEASPL